MPIVPPNVRRVRPFRLCVGLFRRLTRLIPGRAERKPGEGNARRTMVGLAIAFLLVGGGSLGASTSYPSGIVPVEAAAAPAKSVVPRKTWETLAASFVESRRLREHLRSFVGVH